MFYFPPQKKNTKPLTHWRLPRTAFGSSIFDIYDMVFDVKQRWSDKCKVSVVGGVLREWECIQTKGANIRVTSFVGRFKVWLSVLSFTTKYCTETDDGKHDGLKCRREPVRWWGYWGSNLFDVICIFYIYLFPLTHPKEFGFWEYTLCACYMYWNIFFTFLMLSYFQHNHVEPNSNNIPSHHLVLTLALNR